MINASGSQGQQITNVPPHGTPIQSGGAITGGTVRLHTVPVNTIDIVQSIQFAAPPGAAGNANVIVYNGGAVPQYYLCLIQLSTNITWNDYRVFYPAHILPEGWYINLITQAGVTAHAYINLSRYIEEV